MNILSANTVSSKAKTGAVIGTFSHPGANGVLFVLDAAALAYFSVNATNQLVWSPVTGASITTGFYPLNVSAISSGYDAEDSQFIIQITP